MQTLTTTKSTQFTRIQISNLLKEIEDEICSLAGHDREELAADGRLVLQGTAGLERLCKDLMISNSKHCDYQQRDALAAVGNYVDVKDERDLFCLLLGYLYANVLFRREKDNRQAYLDRIQSWALDFLCLAIHTIKDWSGDVLHHALYLFICLQDVSIDQNSALVPSSSRPHTLVILLSFLQNSAQYFELGDCESLKVILDWLCAAAGSKISSLESFTTQLVLKVALTGYAELISSNIAVMKAFLRVEWTGLMERNVAAKVFSKTCRMFINTFRDDQVKKEVALEIFSISMTIHENFISSAAPGEPIDESAFPLIHVLSALSIQYGPLSHNFSSSNSSKRSAWSFMLLSEGQNLLKPKDQKEKANHAALSFFHFAQLFELFPSKDILQNTPMLVETLASVSSLTKESAAEGIDQQLLFCVRCAASWLFCEIVQWESKVAVNTLLSLDIPLLAINPSEITKHQDLIWLLVVLRRLSISLRARTADVMKKSAPDSTVAINRIWSQVLACLAWTPILQKEFEPLSTLLYRTLADCLKQVLRLTKGTLFGNYLQSNRCLGAISKSLVSRGFPPLDGILDPAPGVEKEAEDGFALGTNMTDFKFFALLDTVLLVD